MQRIISHLLTTESSIVAGLGAVLAYKAYVGFSAGTLSAEWALPGVFVGCAIVLYEFVLYQENHSR